MSVGIVLKISDVCYSYFVCLVGSRKYSLKISRKYIDDVMYYIGYYVVSCDVLLL